MKNNKIYLPDYPRTPHVPYKPNMTDDDVLATNDEARIILSKCVEVTEKVDGANCGMTLIDGHPVIRNHNNILNKAYTKNTPAKKQFASIFTWFYKNINKFELMNECGPFSVYGEWLVAQHGMRYDQLPEWFIAFDLYNYDTGNFVETVSARKIMQECGFELAPQIHFGEIRNFEELSEMTNRTSLFTNAPVEGIYIKISDENNIVSRFKMIREGFVQGGLWDSKQIHKNTLR